MITLNTCADILRITLKQAFNLDDRLEIITNDVKHSLEVIYNRTSILKYVTNDVTYMISSLLVDIIEDKERYKKIFKECGDVIWIEFEEDWWKQINI